MLAVNLCGQLLWAVLLAELLYFNCGLNLTVPYLYKVQHVTHCGEERNVSKNFIPESFPIQLAELAWNNAFEGKVIVGNSSSSCQDGMLDIPAARLTISMQGNSFSTERSEKKDSSSCKLPVHACHLSENTKTSLFSAWIHTFFFCLGSCSSKFLSFQCMNAVKWTSSMLSLW